MESLTLDYDSGKLLQELKDNNALPNYSKIKMYKKYLIDEKKLYYPDSLIEFVAREHLGLQYAEEELCIMREEYVNKQNLINKQNKEADEKELQKEEEQEEFIFNNKLKLEFGI